MAKLKVLDEIAKLWDTVKDISLSWGNITDKPTEFPPSPHEHSEYTKTYKSLTEIDPSFTVNTPVKDVVLAMEDNSMATYETSSTDAGVYPTVLGNINIFKQHSYRSYVQFTNTTGEFWHTGYHVQDNPDCEWTQLLTGDDLQSQYTITSSMFRNGWSQFNGHQQTKVIKTGNIVHLVGYVNVGVITPSTIILNIPSGYRPKIAQAFDRRGITLRLDVNGDLIVYGVASGVTSCDFNDICWEVE